MSCFLSCWNALFPPEEEVGRINSQDSINSTGYVAFPVFDPDQRVQGAAAAALPIAAAAGQTYGSTDSSSPPAIEAGREDRRVQGAASRALPIPGAVSDFEGHRLSPSIERRADTPRYRDVSDDLGGVFPLQFAQHPPDLPRPVAVHQLDEQIPPPPLRLTESIYKHIQAAKVASLYDVITMVDGARQSNPLGNFYELPIEVSLKEQGEEKSFSFLCIESAYHAMKFYPHRMDLVKMFTNLRGMTAIEYASRYQKVIREDWEKVQDTVLETLLVEKFQNPQLQALLLATGNCMFELQSESETNILIYLQTLTRIRKHCRSIQLKKERKGFTPSPSILRDLYMDSDAAGAAAGGDQVDEGGGGGARQARGFPSFTGADPIDNIERDLYFLSSDESGLNVT